MLSFETFVVSDIDDKAWQLEKTLTPVQFFIDDYSVDDTNYEVIGEALFKGKL